MKKKNYNEESNIRNAKTEDLLNRLEQKYGRAEDIIKAQRDDACDHLFYDADCNECKGNATGN